MAEPIPPSAMSSAAARPVLEVGGTWTVFSMKGLRQTARQGPPRPRRAAACGSDDGRRHATSSGSTPRARSRSCSLPAAARDGGQDRGEGPRRAVQGGEGEHARAAQARHVDWLTHWLEELGRDLVGLGRQIVNLCAFIGEIIVVFLEAFVSPERFRIGAIVQQMFEVWIKALMIVGVLTFLIGVVIAYQGVQQLRQFGAETFTVEAVGIGMFRELGVLLTAIIVAGRSGSAFTAQIGTMQVNQEVDAMRTIGLNPIEWLVLPRIIALVLSMPLLAFWGDMTGLLGGAVACTVYLDFTFVQFFDRLRDTVGIWHFYTGMIKAPVFGFIIAAIGCFEGLQVSGSAESVGQLTTRSVVESIFCVIVLDAVFSIIFLLANV